MPFVTVHKLFMPILSFLLLGSMGQTSPSHVASFAQLRLHTVTVEEFAQFVKATHYVTEAETYGWSIVQLDVFNYKVMNGATWQKPDGEHPSKAEFPVTQVSYHDAMAYCKWAKVRLPSYSEYWELAKKDQRHIVENEKEFSIASKANVVGNVWDITLSENGQETRLAGGSKFCSMETCHGTAPERELYVDLTTANIHVGFAVVAQ